MTDHVSNNSTTHSCPHLGLVGDPSTCCLYVTPAHRCYRWLEPKGVGERHQVSFCLSDDYRDCFRLVSPENRSSLWRRRTSIPLGRRRLLASIGLASVMLLALSSFGNRPQSGLTLPAFQWGGLAPGPPTPTHVAAETVRSLPPPAVTATSRPAPLSLASGARPVSAPSATAPGPTPTPTASAERAGTSSSARQPTPSRSPAATRSTAAPTSTPTPTPTARTAVAAATPSALTATPSPRTYVVTPGDSLGYLADVFGITVEDLIEANDLGDKNFVWVGQRLVIPEPRR